MVNLFSQFLVVLSLTPSLQILTLRARNERGPSAWKAGIKCLETVERSFDGLTVALQEGDFYYHSKSFNRTTNVIVVQLYNLTSPAAEIEMNYLKLLNHLFSTGDIHRWVGK